MNIFELQSLVECSNFHLCNDYMSDKDWYVISKHISLSENVIEKYSSQLNWSEIWFNQRYSEKFFKKSIDKVKDSDWFAIFDKVKASPPLLREIWAHLPFDNINVYNKLIKWIGKSEEFVGNGVKYESLENTHIENDELVKWHLLNNVLGFLRIYTGCDSNITLKGFRNFCHCHEGSMVIDYAKGSTIIVENNCTIISYQQYTDASAFWRWMNSWSDSTGWLSAAETIWRVRPEWSLHRPLIVKLGENSSVVVNVDGKFYTYKSGTDLEVNKQYMFHVGELKWIQV